jgi:prepilin-type N-terminal cleavage/methylation domain-containing protein/prepilin-type processing-associated H-X9-DG protein
MSHPSQKKKFAGFTLIELLVVIAIIAILAAILFPVFARAREKARQASCQSNLKQLGIAVAQYTQDYDGMYPMAWSESYGTGGNWMNYVQPYVKSLQVFRCPSDSGRDIPGNWAGIPVSYAINATHSDDWPFEAIGTAAAGPCWLADCKSNNESRVQRASQSILIAERHADHGTGFANTGNASGTGMDSVIGSRTPGSPTSWHGEIGQKALYPDGARTGGTCDPSTNTYEGCKGGGLTHKHSDMTNFLFIDGHVKAMQPLATNPHSGNRPQDNMWNATRS